MAEQEKSPLSSSWKNPNAVGRFCLKRKRVRTTPVSSCLGTPASPETIKGNDNPQPNIFLTSPIRSKKKCHNLHPADKSKKASNDKTHEHNRFRDLLSGVEDPAVENVDNTEEDMVDDWSVKLKVRFIVDTSDEYAVAKNSALASGISLIGQEEHASASTLTSSQVFHLNRTYWVYPHVPGLITYPHTSRADMAVIINTKIMPGLAEEWQVSFDSLYDSVRHGYAPYFYILFQNFSILFRSHKCLEFVPTLHAIISPTTSGRRKVLADEGITFSLPLLQDGEMAGKCFDDEGEGEVDTAAATESLDWLESIGLDRQAFPTVTDEARSRNVKQVGGRKVAELDDTAVFVEGMNVHALYNYLRCCKAAVSGLELPPVLLGPQPFVGSTLQVVSCKSSLVQDEHRTVLEVGGPLLPCRFKALSHTITHKQSSCVTIEQTHAFTRITKKLRENNGNQN